MRNCIYLITDLNNIPLAVFDKRYGLLTYLEDKDVNQFRMYRSTKTKRINYGLGTELMEYTKDEINQLLKERGKIWVFRENIS